VTGSLKVVMHIVPPVLKRGIGNEAQAKPEGRSPDGEGKIKRMPPTLKEAQYVGV
jgi:hypothetical protein